MLRTRVFPIVAAVAAVCLAGCSQTVKDAYFRGIELTPVSQAGVETVADLQVISAKKVIGMAKGMVTNPEQRHSLYVEAVELAIASDPSGADVLVAPSYFEKTEDRIYVTVTVTGYPARYKNFRHSEKPPFFSVKQMPGGVTVINYDKNAFTAKMENDNLVSIRTVAKDGSVSAAPDAPRQAPPPAGGEAGTATSTAAQTGE
jgi:hypothetical protein